MNHPDYVSVVRLSVEIGVVSSGGFGLGLAAQGFVCVAGDLSPARDAGEYISDRCLATIVTLEIIVESRGKPDASVRPRRIDVV